MKLIEAMLGSKAAMIFKHLYTSPRELRDEEIASSLGLRLNEVRRNLYALSEHGFASYRRVRDKETGWYIYYWRVERGQLKALIRSRKEMVLHKLKERLAYEESNAFYECPLDHSRYTFDEALENEFTCPKCGSSLVYVDNSEIVEVLKERIRKLEKSLKRR